jgi:cytoskeletal protein CcmA (bactofilin family)
MTESKLNLIADNKDLVIGKGVKFKGIINAPNNVTINGEYEGELHAHKILIGIDGVITGYTTANDVEIEGQANNVVECKQLLTVHSTGVVKGKISYGSLDIKRGGKINGDLNQI